MGYFVSGFSVLIFSFFMGVVLLLTGGESWGCHEFLEHCLDSVECLFAHSLDPIGGKEESVSASVGQLDGEGILEAQPTLGPVITST